MAENKPVYRLQIGSVAVAVFANDHQRSDGSSFVAYSTQLQRRYRDDAGQWQTSSSLALADLPTAVHLLEMALQFCLGRLNNEVAAEANE